MAYNPVRAGTRGGQGDFKWSDVKDDKDRENYLGHSILAPVGRWQKHKDITWYNKGKTDDEARALELKQIKENEEDALAVALGFTPTPRAPAGPSAASPPAVDPNAAILAQAAKDAAKEAHRREKDARKAERAARREEKAKDPDRHHHHHKSSRRHGDDHGDRPRRDDRERDRPDVKSRWEGGDERESGRDHERERRGPAERRRSRPPPAPRRDGHGGGRDRSRSPARR